ncbi:hypothetical protein ABH945_005270 [Paraburkholderia sp. GAS333]|uniref:hypothetical protein n=1 Tax=Paraburkholderia sp. GAS333 TaxID=3156279 RepID=UPI003D1BBE59
MRKRFRQRKFSNNGCIPEDFSKIHIRDGHPHLPVSTPENRLFFSPGYIHDSNKAYTQMALRDFSLQSYVSVASMPQIQKITEGVTYVSLRSLKFRPSLDPTTELDAAIA